MADEVNDAQTIDAIADLQTQAQGIQTEEAQAIAQGDFAGAHEFAIQAEQDLQGVADAGGDPNLVNDAFHDTLNTDWASWEQATADGNAATADSYLQAGDVDHAEQYAGVAESDAGSAADFAGGAAIDLSSETAAADTSSE